MELRVVAGDITQFKVSAIVVNLFEGTTMPSGATGAVDRTLDGAIAQLIADGEVKGMRGELTLVHTLGKLPPSRVLVLGLGKAQDLGLDALRSVMAEACRYLRRLGCQHIATVAHGAGQGGLAAEEAAQALVEGSLLGLYAFKRHKTKDESKDIQQITIVEHDASKLSALQKGVQRGIVIAESACLSRDMINEPANIMTPTRMAEEARKVAAGCALECTIHDRKQLEDMGMGALLGVAQGSVQPPKFIALRYMGNPRNPSQLLALVGKSITFDSGGLDLKPPEGMREMKRDMAGGAAVLGAIRAIALLKEKVNVLAIMAATENMPGGSAQRPGDVVRAMNGRTIEIDNTDAEGRLTLADAICYAKKQGATHIVDVATLTGAIRTALGTTYAGVFSNNQPFVSQVIEAGAKAGERLWQFPLDNEYKEQNRAEIADIKNSGGPGGGSITAAEFIHEFAEDTPWVHLDIAATARVEADKGYKVKGATGMGARTLVNLAAMLSQG